MTACYIVRGVNVAGDEFFYTGRAGEGWLSKNPADAFAYGREGAERKAMLFTRDSWVHCLTFTAVERAA